MINSQLYDAAVADQVAMTGAEVMADLQARIEASESQYIRDQASRNLYDAGCRREGNVWTGPEF